MKIEKINLREVGTFAPIFTEYLEKKEGLAPFYRYFPDMEGFGKIIRERKMPERDRLILQEVLNEEYGALEKSDKVTRNILSLQYENTFTVTTGHQLNIFTGPLYFIFKIVTTINLAKKLKETFPDYHFVPVYWMASEDHDFEEISHFNLFGKKYEWKTDQKGPVGRFVPQSLNELIDEIPENIPLFEKAYLDSSSLADAVRYYVNELFGQEGLLVIDADNSKLKSEFAEIIKRDIVEKNANRIVEDTNLRLNETGYTTQAFSREINFFYLNSGRERIVEEDGKYIVKNTELVFEKDELLSLVDMEPERFSPNVIMRPLYQEKIMPNIAYIGGPSEIAYWLQLKGVFDHYEMSFPILMPRNFGMVINKGNIKKIQKIGLKPIDLFKEAHDLKAAYLERHADNEHYLDSEKQKMSNVFEEIKQKATAIDQSLEGYIGAESSKAEKMFQNIEKRLKKANENQNDTAMKQIDSIKEKLFPGGGLQERHDNFLNFYLNNPQFIQQLIDSFDPLDFSFYQFWED